MSDCIITRRGSAKKIQSLSVTENGTYTAPSGVDGYSPITVSVAGGGSIGHVVTFADTLGVSVESVDIASGYSVVNPQLSIDGTRIQSAVWKDANDNVISFPYTPSEDIVLHNATAIAYIINPDGTTIPTILTHPDGTASTITSVSGRAPTVNINSYSTIPTSSSKHMWFNTRSDVWKYGGRYDSNGYNVAMYTDAIDCRLYNHALFHVLPFYAGGYGAENIYLATSIQSTWYPAASFASYNLGSSTYTLAYYQSLYGSGWTLEYAAMHLDDPAWQDWVVDISTLNSFYLWLHFCDGGGLCAYAYLY